MANIEKIKELTKTSKDFRYWLSHEFDPFHTGLEFGNCYQTNAIAHWLFMRGLQTPSAMATLISYEDEDLKPIILFKDEEIPPWLRIYLERWVLTQNIKFIYNRKEVQGLLKGIPEIARELLQDAKDFELWLKTLPSKEIVGIQGDNENHPLTEYLKALGFIFPKIENCNLLFWSGDSQQYTRIFGYFPDDIAPPHWICHYYCAMKTYIDSYPIITAAIALEILQQVRKWVDC